MNDTTNKKAERRFEIKDSDGELLHPLTDCNGCSGRILWMWMTREAPLGFLHTFHYRALDGARNRI